MDALAGATKQIRLLVVSHSYPPVLGGSEMEAQRVCATLLRRGHQVTVLCAGGDPMPDLPRWVDPAGVPVRIFGRNVKGRRRDRAFSLGVVRTLVAERRNYDLVYFLMQGLHLAAGLPVARRLGKPILMKISGSGMITKMRESRLGRLELRWLERWAYRVMVLNPGMVEEGLAAGFSPSRLYWMPNPVDAGEFAPCRPDQREELRVRLGIPRQAGVIVFTGRLAPEKQLFTLLEAFALAIPDMPHALLVLVGDGPVRKDLEEAARRLGVDGRVRFTGRLSAGETREWLQASDVFALVSSHEGFSCSLAEAMATGLASVVSDIPGNAQLIEDGVHGVHTAVGDARSTARAFIRLFGNEALRLEMGAAARQQILDRYAMDEVAIRYEMLFAEALQRREPDSGLGSPAAR